MKISRRITHALGAAAGGLLAATFLPLAVAFADTLVLEPDTATFDPYQATGFPPLFNQLTGDEYWNLEFASGAPGLDHAVYGVDTETTMGSFVNDDFLVKTVEGNPPPSELQIDLTQFGGGFANEWVDVAAYGGNPESTSDLLITPFGDYVLYGDFFAA